MSSKYCLSTWECEHYINQDKLEGEEEMPEKTKWYSVEQEKARAWCNDLEHAIQEAKKLDHEDLVECLQCLLDEHEELFNQIPQ